MERRPVPAARQGHYESWFQRANDPSGQRAFWIRYTIFAPRGRYAPYDWQIETSGPDGSLAVRISATAADFVALCYDNPPGGAKTCRNSKIARAELTLRRGGTTTVLRSSRTAFEILDDTAPPGVAPAV